MYYLCAIPLVSMLHHKNMGGLLPAWGGSLMACAAPVSVHAPLACTTLLRSYRIRHWVSKEGWQIFCHPPASGLLLRCFKQYKQHSWWGVLLFEEHVQVPFRYRGFRYVCFLAGGGLHIRMGLPGLPTTSKQWLYLPRPYLWSLVTHDRLAQPFRRYILTSTLQLWGLFIHLPRYCTALNAQWRVKLDNLRSAWPRKVVQERVSKLQWPCVQYFSNCHDWCSWGD
jgi:hypothetical protein